MWTESPSPDSNTAAANGEILHIYLPLSAKRVHYHTTRQITGIDAWS